MNADEFRADRDKQEGFTLQQISDFLCVPQDMVERICDAGGMFEPITEIQVTWIWEQMNGMTQMSFPDDGEEAYKEHTQPY